MSNTYLVLDSENDVGLFSCNNIQLTAFTSDALEGGLQVNLGPHWVTLNKRKALVLAQAIIARYAGDIGETDISTFPHILNLVHQERTK